MTLTYFKCYIKREIAHLRTISFICFRDWLYWNFIVLTENGTHLAAPSKYPYLRCTRVLQPGMVLTIEPGIYFIESLLAPWREGQFSKHFNWQKIEALKPFGGIRIEDNVVVHENNIENMTRDLKLA